MPSSGVRRLKMNKQAAKKEGPTKKKAKKMLKDKKVRGKKLTGKQKRYFGMIANS